MSNFPYCHLRWTLQAPPVYNYCRANVTLVVLISCTTCFCSSKAVSDPAFSQLSACTDDTLRLSWISTEWYHVYSWKGAYTLVKKRAHCAAASKTQLQQSSHINWQSRDSMKISPHLFNSACMYEMSCAFSFVAKSASNPDLTDQCCVYILRPLRELCWR